MRLWPILLIAGAFLGWLEKEKDPLIIRRLNQACRDRTYRPERFTDWCGADLDTLWDEYVRSRH